MNLSVDRVSAEALDSAAVRRHSVIGPVAMAAILPLWSLVSFAHPADGLGPVMLALSAAAFFVTIAAFYVTARLAFERQTYLLWGGVVAAVVIGFALSGLSELWAVLMATGAIWFGGVLPGRLAAMGRHEGFCYAAGMIAVGLLHVALFGPMWPSMIAGAKQAIPGLMEQFKQASSLVGSSPEEVTANLMQTERLMEIIVGLIPAGTFLSAQLQFAIGFVLFAVFVSRRHSALSFATPFEYWRISFAVAPLVVVAIAFRLLGGGWVVAAADNLIAVLSVFYCVAGLTLAEFYLRAFRLPMLLRVLFYVLMLLTHIVGFFVMALLGFVDSFANWRKRQVALDEE